MKKSVNVILTLALLLITVVAISGCAQYGGNQAAQPPALPEQPSPAQQPEAAAPAAEKTVEITAEGFTPGTLTIKAGETVVFVNKATVPSWPASAAHPTHVVYPELGGCLGSKFDACKGLAEGETFEFVFSEKGSWKYHDHLNCCSDPAFFGTIVVE